MTMEMMEAIRQEIRAEMQQLRFQGDSKIAVLGSFPSFQVKSRSATQQGGFPNASGAVALPPLGWQVLTQYHSSNWQWAVVKGVLFDTQTNDPTQTSPLSVTGCLTPGPLSPTDSAWANIGTAPAKIWMEGSYTTAGWPVLDSAPYINTTDYDGGALEYATTTDSDGNTIYVQTYWRRLLAKVIAFNSDGSPQLMSVGLGSLYLTNGGDYANLSDGSTPKPVPIIFPRA